MHYAWPNCRKTLDWPLFHNDCCNRSSTVQFFLYHVHLVSRQHKKISRPINSHPTVLKPKSQNSFCKILTDKQQHCKVLHAGELSFEWSPRTISHKTGLSCEQLLWIYFLPISSVMRSFPDFLKRAESMHMKRGKNGSKPTTTMSFSLHLSWSCNIFPQWD